MKKLEHYSNEEEIGFYMTGSNVPSLNALLNNEFGTAFGSTITKGKFFVGDRVV